MNPYVKKLRLKHDPFDGGLRRDDFFGGGGRDNLVYKLLESEDRQVSLHAVIGAPGSGKTRLAHRLREVSGNDFRTALITIDLLTSAQNLLRDLLLNLKLDPSGDIDRDLETLRECVMKFSRSDKSVLLLIDHAHELGPDCIKLIGKLLANGLSAVNLVLFGDEQLREMLQTRLHKRIRSKLSLHELSVFNRVETAEYIRLKLARAGYSHHLPLSSQAGLDLLQQSAGRPGKIDKLAGALLNSDAVPEVGGLFGRRRKKASEKDNSPAVERPEFRYLMHAFALSLALAVVVLWPAVEPGSSASPAGDAIEPRQITLPMPARPQSDATESLDAAPENTAAAVVSPSATAPVADEPSGPSEFELMLLDSPPDSFTVQIIASTSEEGVREFIAAAQLGGFHGYFETRRQRGPWFVVVDGLYPEWEAAREAQLRRAGEFEDLEPWIRRISDVKSQIALAGKIGEF